MSRLPFSAPFEALPALERVTIRLRANEITLVLYYTEIVKFSLLDMIQHREEFLARLPLGAQPRIAGDAKSKIGKILRLMLHDNAISLDEKGTVEKLINFRNDIGHRIDHLFADLEQSKFIAPVLHLDVPKKRKLNAFDYSVVSSMKQIENILARATKTHYRFGRYRIRGDVLFSSTRNTLEKENRTLRTRLDKLIEQRTIDERALVAEIEIGQNILIGSETFDSFPIRHERGKMTFSGENFCFKLFQIGISDLAIAHIFEMKLRSIRSRRKEWLRSHK